MHPVKNAETTLLNRNRWGFFRVKFRLVRQDIGKGELLDTLFGREGSLLTDADAPVAARAALAFVYLRFTGTVSSLLLTQAGSCPSCASLEALRPPLRQSAFPLHIGGALSLALQDVLALNQTTWCRQKP